MKQLVTEIGEAGLLTGRALACVFRGQILWDQVFILIERFGIQSLPIVGLSASFIGMAMSVQIAKEIVERYGADNAVGGFIALTMLRELGPVFVAIVIVGNVGAAIAAELGAMNVTDQIDAMKVFRLDPLVYLVVPRLVATVISGPVLTTMGGALALFSGQLFTEYLVQIPAEVFWDSVQYTAAPRDIANMLTKSVVFAVAISIIAAYNGLSTKGGSEAVGIFTTRTVIFSLLTIFLLNYLLTTIFFYF